MAAEGPVRRHRRALASAMMHTARLLVERLDRQLRGGAAQVASPRSFAVVPTRPDLDVSWLLDELAAGLSAYGAPVRIDARTVDAALGKPGLAQVAPDDPAHGRVAAWLAAQEALHDNVLYAADPTWTAWTERAVRQADVVLLVAEGRDASVVRGVERRLDGLGRTARLPERVLVLLQPRGQRVFPGSARALEARPAVTRHFHVRERSRDDVRRAVRLLTGRGVGLVFAGGGSRGFAHIGVLRALEELGIPIDAAGGASVGAMIAGCCGLELGWREVERQLPRLMQRAFYQPTLPVVSFMTGQAVLDGAKQLAGGDYDLEDFAVPAFYVATDLAGGGPAVLRRGSSALGIRASSAIPGIFPPVARGRALLVDGGLSNNLPVDVMAEQAGAVVGVDIIPDLPLGADRQTQLTASGLRELASRARGTAGLPSILSVLMCTATSSAQGLRSGARAARPTDLVLQPVLTRWNMINFSSPGPIVHQGYVQSRPALEAWWRERRGHILGETP
ncbi:MAG: patatin-like phospholipase family protein [Myxococcota bacterium]